MGRPVEAHQAMTFVSQEGIDIHFFREAVKTFCLSLLGIYHYRYTRMHNVLLQGLFPASSLSLVAVLTVVLGLYWSGRDPTYGLLSWLQATESVMWFLLLLESLCVWLLLSQVQYFTLKALLSYQGWMFDERGKRSLCTKLWAASVRMLTGPFKPMLYSYQRVLPRQPVPPLEDTCRKYLESVRPLLEDDQYSAVEKLVDDFKNGPGRKLQSYLVLKSWLASSYINDWWETYNYMHKRSSLMINSNFYACDSVGLCLTQSPVSRAAMISHICMRLKADIETERLAPSLIMNLVPLCSAQYKRMFGTTRIPGLKADKLVHVSPAESLHCVVYRAGRWYKVQLATGKRIFTPVELEQQFKTIMVDSAGDVSWSEEHLAALTAWDRPNWAATRQKYFSSGPNKESLDTIEKAAFVMFLEDSTPSTQCTDGNCTPLSSYCSDLLHGSGFNKWFDKSLTITVFGNGKYGVNAEHSWADGPTVGYLLEYISDMEHSIGYNQNGSCKSLFKTSPPPPKRLTWDIQEEAVNCIRDALSFTQGKIQDADLYVLEHNVFGKGDIKAYRISPDAFIQMALQLAYYKDSGGKFCLTKEATTGRLFLEGRTAHTRPVTAESVAFVHAMCNTTVSRDEKERLLRAAVDRHVLGYKLAMVGQGIDRHLFCLYTMSRYLKIKSPFLTQAMGEPWTLFTSQTPPHQTGKVDFDKMPDRISGGGGLGPMAVDGYSVSYIIQGDHVIYFHVSSFHSASNTNSRRFAGFIKDSMAEMRDLVSFQRQYD